MAYRRTGQSSQKKRTSKSRARSIKTKPVSIPVTKTTGSRVENQVVQVPVNRSIVNEDDCAIMYWGSFFENQGYGSSTPGGLPQGIAFQVNPINPTSGQFAPPNLTYNEWLQFWGQTGPSGVPGQLVPASVKLTMNFQLTINSGGAPWWFNFIDLYPGMINHFIRIYSKAIIIRAANNATEECWFEIKNFMPFYAEGFPVSSCDEGDSDIGIDGGSGGSFTGYPACVPFEGLQNYRTFYFGLNEVPLDRCLWKNAGLTFHDPGQSPSFVAPGPNSPVPYGLDANFGLDMNSCIPVFNQWQYGDRIILGGLTAAINPFWGSESCSYAFSVDTDGDGVPDQFYGDYIGISVPTEVDGNQIYGIGFGSSGGTVQTLLPSEEITLIVQ